MWKISYLPAVDASLGSYICVKLQFFIPMLISEILGNKCLDLIGLIDLKLEVKIIVNILCLSDCNKGRQQEQ